jgi:hypothetical protein
MNDLKGFKTVKVKLRRKHYLSCGWDETHSGQLGEHDLNSYFPKSKYWSKYVYT